MKSFVSPLNHHEIPLFPPPFLQRQPPFLIPTKRRVPSPHLAEVFGAQGFRHGVHTAPHVAPEGEGQLEVLVANEPRRSTAEDC